MPSEPITDTEGQQLEILLRRVGVSNVLQELGNIFCRIIDDNANAYESTTLTQNIAYWNCQRRLLHSLADMWTRHYEDLEREPN